MKTHRDGQALVEFALVLPLLLFLLVGAMAVGALLIHRLELTHTANELATAAATTDCAAAMVQADALLGYAPDSVTCGKQGELITVHLSHTFPALVPFLPDRIAVVAHALVR